MAEEETNEEQTQEQSQEETTENESSDGEPTEDDITGNKEQVKRLREERNELQKKQEEEQDETKQEVQELKKEVSEIKFNRRVDQYADGDEAKRKAIKQEFENYRPGETGDEAVSERLEKAASLVTGSSDSPSATDGSATSAGGGKNTDTSGSDSTESGIPESTKEQGNKLGMDEEDYEKYGDQVTQ